MNKNLKYLLCIICLCLNLSKARAQELNKVISPSPNAASLMKFADIPVSTYTGIPSIDIPLYSVSSESISVPISLSYHASGIRLNEEAGLVGLGWALNAGGAISRTVMDKQDFAGGYFKTNLPDIPASPVDLNIIDKNTTAGLGGHFQDVYGNYYNVLSAADGTGFMDTEADIFSYNFSGKSGKFIITRKGKVILNKQEDIKVLYDPSGNWFVIIDENGFKYKFDTKELTQDFSSGATHISSWFLSEIKSPQKDIITFLYDLDNDPGDTETYSINKSEVWYYGCTAPGPVSSETYNRHKEVAIKKIIFNGGFIEFFSNENRQDLNGSNKLDSVKVIVTGKSQQKVIKKWKFQYGYFNHNIYASNPMDYKRLKLEKINEITGKISLPGHSFNYIEPTEYDVNLTYKKSNSIDHWGYFNGYPNKTLIPRYQGEFSPSGGYANYIDLDGANRDPRPGYSKIFSLKEILYPTGGKSQFEMESHDFDFVRSINLNGPNPQLPAPILVPKTLTIRVSEAGLSQNSVTFNNLYGASIKMKIAFRCSDYNGCSTVKTNLQYERIYFEGNGSRRDITNSDLECGSSSPVCSAVPITIPMNNTNVLNWKGYIDPSIGDRFQEIYVVLEWTEIKTIQTVDNSGAIPAGGLRIKSLTDFSDLNTIAKKRVYSYNYEKDTNNDGVMETFSYGRRMSSPSYEFYDVSVVNTGQGSCNTCRMLVRNANSQTSLTSSAQGSAVGYDKVIEYLVNPTDNASLGKTEYFYDNFSDFQSKYVDDSNNNIRKPGLQNLVSNRNGLLLEKKVFSSNGVNHKIIFKEIKKYASSRKRSYYSFKSEKIDPPCDGSGTWFIFSAYPSLTTERILLDSTITCTYNSDDTTKFVQVINKNYYDTLFTLPIKTKTYTSDNKVIISDLKYPINYIAGLSSINQMAKDSLVARHIIAPVLEQVVTKNNVLVSKTRNNYKLFSTNLVLPENIELQQGNGSLEKRVEFQQYDEVGNLVQQAKTNDVPTVYLWGYNKSQPIVQVTNAIFNQNNIFHTSFEEDLANVSTVARTGQQSHTGTYSLPMPKQSGTYILSYWEKASAEEWQYKEDKISINSSTTPDKVIGTSNTSIIDEVRLYPISAQMTTYTYDPLVGMTSATDANNVTSFYVYDGLGRLSMIKDDKGNILKTFKYNYKQN